MHQHSHLHSGQDHRHLKNLIISLCIYYFAYNYNYHAAIYFSESCEKVGGAMAHLAPPSEPALCSSVVALCGYTH